MLEVPILQENFGSREILVLNYQGLVALLVLDDVMDPYGISPGWLATSIAVWTLIGFVPCGLARYRVAFLALENSKP